MKISSNEERQAKHPWIPLSLSTNSGLFFFSSDKYLPMKINRPSTLGFPCFHQIPTGLSFPDNFFFLDWILIFFWIFWDTWTSSGISDRYITPSRTSPPPRLGEHFSRRPHRLGSRVEPVLAENKNYQLNHTPSCLANSNPWSTPPETLSHPTFPRHCGKVWVGGRLRNKRIDQRGVMGEGSSKGSSRKVPWKRSRDHVGTLILLT